METIRALLIAIVVITICGLASIILVESITNSTLRNAVPIVERALAAVYRPGITVIYTPYAVCSRDHTVEIYYSNTMLTFKVPKKAESEDCCIGTCTIISTEKTFRITISNISINPITVPPRPSNKTRIIYKGETTCTTRCVHIYHCKQILNIRFVSYGFCPVNYSFRMVSQVVCVGRNCTYSISVTYSPSLVEYIGVFRHTNRSIIIGLEDCSCCDFDKRDEVLNITILRNMTHIVILQSKGGYSHRLYINGREVYYKPPGVYKTNIDLGNYPMKCILKKHCYEVCR
ncbi:MAG: hypothetical protein GXO26_04610 [Crenarchaeota archaeon]|nr:hypothetical protein [Thermoproteota archaeon]